MTNPTEAQKVMPEIFAFNHSTGMSAEGFSREQVKPLVEALRELYAQVKGECPSLLNEDSGGDGMLDIEIKDLLAQWSDV